MHLSQQEVTAPAGKGVLLLIVPLELGVTAQRAYTVLNLDDVVSTVIAAPFGKSISSPPIQRIAIVYSS
jgi:hypothetical protein